MFRGLLLVKMESVYKFCIWFFFVLFFFLASDRVVGAFLGASLHCNLYVHRANHLRGFSWQGALVKWLMWSQLLEWTRFIKRRQQNEHIPLFYKTCHSIFIAVGICKRVLKRLNSFTFTGSQNCKWNVLNINVLFFHCCASSVCSCIYSRSVWSITRLFLFFIPVNTWKLQGPGC